MLRPPSKCNSLTQHSRRECPEQISARARAPSLCTRYSPDLPSLCRSFRVMERTCVSGELARLQRAVTRSCPHLAPSKPSQSNVLPLVGRIIIGSTLARAEPITREPIDDLAAAMIERGLRAVFKYWRLFNACTDALSYLRPRASASTCFLWLAPYGLLRITYYISLIITHHLSHTSECASRKGPSSPSKKERAEARRSSSLSRAANSHARLSRA
jgi:hypothetical protein